MTPSGLEHLTKEDRNESFVLYFEIAESIRKERQRIIGPRMNEPLPSNDGEKLRKKFGINNCDFVKKF